MGPTQDLAPSLSSHWPRTRGGVSGLQKAGHQGRDSLRSNGVYVEVSNGLTASLRARTRGRWHGKVPCNLEAYGLQNAGHQGYDALGSI